MYSKLEKSNSIIYLSLLKYKSYNFSLEILEYCDKDELIYREQYYIDSLEPEYNILKIAASRKGFKLSSETKGMISNALKGRVFSDKSLERMKIAAINRKGDRTSFYGKRHTYETKGKMASKKYIKVKITDLQTKQISLFKGNVEASNFLNIGESTLRRYKNTKTLYLDRYLIEKDELVFEKKKSLRSSIG